MFRTFVIIILTISFNYSRAQLLPVMGPIIGQATLCSAPSAAQLFTASATNSPMAFGWTVTPSTGVVISSQGNAVTGISFPATNSLYVVNCVAVNLNGAAAIPATFTVVVYETPQVTFSGGGTFCQGSPTSFQASPTTISASSTISYSWIPAAGLSATNIAAPVANPTASTIYTVNYAIGQCSNTAQLSVISTPLPAIFASVSPSSVCKGQPALLSMSGSALVISYSLNAQSSPANVNITTGNMAAGPYTYTASGSDIYGCSNSTTVGLQINSLPSFNGSLSLPAICLNQTNTLTITGNAASYSVNGTAVSTLAVIPSGNPFLSITGINLAGCTNTVSTFFNILPTPQVNATLSNSVICKNNTATLSINGTATSYSLNGQPTSTTAVLGNTMLPGVYNYTVSCMNNSGCTNATAPFSLTVSDCTGLQEEPALIQLKVFPNPSGGSFSILSSQEFEGIIVDNLGRVVLCLDLVPGFNKVNSQLPSGVYYLRAGGINSTFVVVSQ